MRENVERDLQSGLAHHQAGRLAEAQACYCQVLKTDPQQPDALHLMGVAAQQTGEYDAAIGLISAAIRSHPQAAHYHNNLANTYLLQGNTKAAIGSYRHVLALNPGDGDAMHSLANALVKEGEYAEAIRRFEHLLRLRPQWPEAHYHLGNAWHQGGNLQKAAACYRRAIQLDANRADFHFNLAHTLSELGALAEAAEAYRRVLALTPADAEAHYSLGVILQELGHREEAIDAYTQALHLKPDYAEAWSNLGCVHEERGDWDAALEAQRRALAVDGTRADTHNNLGAALAKLGDEAGARACFARALELQPRHVMARCNLGYQLAGQGDFMGARECYRQAVACDPASPTAHFYLGVTELSLGNFSAGWKEYEFRWNTKEFRGRKQNLRCPQWRGEALENARILLYAEQGLGDTMQFVRYVPLVAARGGQVVLEAPAGLSRLLSRVQGVSELVVQDEPLPDFQWQSPLMSLPLAFGTDEASIPAPVPYLSADPGLAKSWAGKLQPGLHPSKPKSSSLGTPVRVGLAWAGSPKHVRERQRSIPLAQLAPLLALKGATFYSLQKGPAAGQCRSLPAGLQVIDLEAEQQDFADTAAIVANLDLVISIDTSIAHLAGAMGKPVWILLHDVPDWRWLLNRDDSPWYPTARLFRQSVGGIWDDVVARVRRELERLIVAQPG
jgi:tetratricopeptide (TPR) repeat protein